jgi:hypothetical protein
MPSLWVVLARSGPGTESFPPRAWSENDGTRNCVPRFDRFGVADVMRATIGPSVARSEQPSVAIAQAAILQIGKRSLAGCKAWDQRRWRVPPRRISRHAPGPRGDTRQSPTACRRMGLPILPPATVTSADGRSSRAACGRLGSAWRHSASGSPECSDHPPGFALGTTARYPTDILSASAAMRRRQQHSERTQSLPPHSLFPEATLHLMMGDRRSAFDSIAGRAR